MSSSAAVAYPVQNSQNMTEPAPPPSAPRAPRSRYKRRTRGPANPENRPNRQPEPSDSQPSQPPRQNQPTQPDQPGSSNRPDDAQRARRGNRRRGRGNGNQQVPEGSHTEKPSHPQSRGMKARGFGAKLTKPDQDRDAQQESSTMNDPNLRADAPDFVPGLPSSHTQPASSGKGKGKSKPKPPPKEPKVTTKSTADHIATRIHEDITHNLYECPICTSELGRRSKVWSCQLCWTVFHLSCIKKWSTNEGAAAQRNRQLENGDEPIAARAWRCPGCNLAHETLPTTYSCWCEKDIDPRPLPGLPPHSCGQTCSRPRKGCPHPCDSTCHAGPCKPCTAMGPTQDCFCGRNSSQKRCQDTDYERGWSCGEICGDLLPCGEHTCQLPCHEGLCGACEVKIDARCYCGKVQTEMLCSSKEDEEESQTIRDDGSEEEWTGCFGCTDICNRLFDCGLHSCEKDCHPQDLLPAHCPKSPDTVLRCPCGKTPLEKIAGYTPRTSCEDPIPNCSEPCGKMLKCGHSCDQICHTGPCGSCHRRMPIQCQCGRTTSMSICHQGDIQQPQCFRMCKTNLHCGRHTCTERCCPGEQKAIERQAIRRKLKSHLRPTDEDIEAEHICTRICGRILKCGRHTCPELCHKGACNTCREAIFEEISCNCGRTILYPPQPCGTKPPDCSFPCERQKPCGHPQTAHTCHTDEESCPKCPFLTEKECLCGDQIMKNVPCWLTEPRCGQPCRKPLKCGSHFCKKDCHRDGECEDETKPCQQPCGKSKGLCGHPCTEPCHAPYPCPEKTPCSSTLAVTCSCGRLRQERRCNAAKAIISKGVMIQPERLPVTTPLTCDDECTRLERNRSLASALGVDINQSTTVQAFSASNLPYSSETLDQYIKLASTVSLSTLQTYESTLHSLAKDATNRSIRFAPAKSTLRAFSHSLATDWGFVTESHDPEPHRHVFVLKPLSWTPPVFGMGSGTSIGIGGLSVRECVKLRERERTKEREIQRVTALEAKAAREAIKAQAGAAGDGWAQVASRGKKGSAESSLASTRSSTPMQSMFGSRTMFSALGEGAGAAKKERLVLRSGIGASKSSKSQPEIVDSWEEAEEKEEQVERAIEQERSYEEGDLHDRDHRSDVNANDHVEDSALKGSDDELLQPAEVVQSEQQHALESIDVHQDRGESTEAAAVTSADQVD